MPIVYRKVSISNVRVAIPTAPGTRMSNEWDYLKDGEIKERRVKYTYLSLWSLKFLLKHINFHFISICPRSSRILCVRGSVLGVEVERMR